MKQARQAIARWATKLFAPAKHSASTSTKHAPRSIDAEQLDAEQLRQVAAGGSDAAQSPKGNW